MSFFFFFMCYWKKEELIIICSQEHWCLKFFSLLLWLHSFWYAIGFLWNTMRFYSLGNILLICNPPWDCWPSKFYNTLGTIQISESSQIRQDHVSILMRKMDEVCRLKKQQWRISNGENFQRVHWFNVVWGIISLMR